MRTRARMSGLEIIAVFAALTPTDSFFKLRDALPKSESPTDFRSPSCALEINDLGAAVPTDYIFAVRADPDLANSEHRLQCCTAIAFGPRF